jgi:hypothetical protein
MDNRKGSRYEISEYINDNFCKDIHLEIKNDIAFNPVVIDISMYGIGFSIEENVDVFDSLTDFFININFCDRTVLAEVKKVWSVRTEESGRKLLKGGLVFSVLSPEDRLYLADYLNAMRK